MSNQTMSCEHDFAERAADGPCHLCAASVSAILEDMGEEVTWELLKSDGRWFVWLSRGEPDAFKFSAGSRSLEVAMSIVVDDARTHGPKWLRK